MEGCRESPHIIGYGGLFESHSGGELKKACFFLGFFLLLSMAVTAQHPHDRAFWQGIVKNHYAVPEHESPDLLANELSSLLASPDPELRDDLEAVQRRDGD